MRDPLTLAAMRKVPRHEFVPAEARAEAYDDNPLPIGHGQTISQPYIVAFMTEALGLRGRRDRAGGRDGLGLPGRRARGDRGPGLHDRDRRPAGRAARGRTWPGSATATSRCARATGTSGWPEAAPFDAIIVTAAAPRIPEPLKAQLKDGGRLVIPVGEEYQSLVVLTRTGIPLRRADRAARSASSP